MEEAKRRWWLVLVLHAIVVAVLCCATLALLTVATYSDWIDDGVPDAPRGQGEPDGGLTPLFTALGDSAIAIPAVLVMYALVVIAFKSASQRRLPGEPAKT